MEFLWCIFFVKMQVALVWSSPISVKVFKCPQHIPRKHLLFFRTCGPTWHHISKRSQSGVKKAPKSPYLISVVAYGQHHDEHETCVIVTQWAFTMPETHIFLWLYWWTLINRVVQRSDPKKCAEFHTWRILVDFCVLLSFFLNWTAVEAIISSLDIPAN